MDFAFISVGARESRAGRRHTRRCVIDDGFNSELVETAFFDGVLEIPKLEKPKEIILPECLIPFTKRNSSTDFSETLAFYEQDVRFSGILQNPEAYIDDFRRFRGIVSPDFSLYRDMPLQAQMNNVYRNRALGCFFQRHGIYVIPNVRWGDERSYTTAVLPECFAFLGVPKHNIVSIGTYGCIRGRKTHGIFGTVWQRCSIILSRRSCWCTEQCRIVSSLRSPTGPDSFDIPTGSL